MDVITKLDKSKTNKYTPMLIRVLTDKINKTYQNQEDLKYIAEELGNIFGLELHNFDVAEQVIFYRLYESILNNSDYQLINNFIELNERKIENGVDVQKIETLEDMNRYLCIASLKMVNKELRNQVVVDYDSDEWLLIRPITFESSIKYGAGTKWCTTSESNPDHFFRYSKRGCLIYIINKLNGYKVACYKNFEEKQIEFYNQEDIRVDSMMVDLPMDILGRIKDIIMSTIISNKELDVEKWTMSEKLIEKNQLKIRLLEPTEPGHWVGEEEIQSATI